MEYIIGIDKFPLMKFDDNKYAHIFPVTKYQFERYIWETAPDINYDQVIQASSRISPTELSKKSFKDLYMTGLSFTESTDFAKWMGGRLPIQDEIKVTYELLSSITIKGLYDRLRDNKGLDARVLMVLNKILDICPSGTISNTMELAGIKDFFSTMVGPPYRPIYVKHKWGEAHVVGNSACTDRIEDAGWRVILENID